MKKSFPVLFYLLFFLSSLSHGHLLLQGVGTQSVIKFSSKDIQIELNVGFSPTEGFLKKVKIDSDHDDEITSEEAELFVKETFKAIKPELFLQLDDNIMDLKLVSTRTDSLKGRVGQHSFDIYYDLKSEFPRIMDNVPHILTYRDNTFAKEVSNQLIWFPEQKETDILSSVIKPEVETIVDTVRAVGRETVVLLGKDPFAIDKWIEKNPDEVENYDIIKKPPIDIFQELTKAQIPAAELIINRKKSILRVLTNKKTLPSEWGWDLKITARGKEIPSSCIGKEPFELDSLLSIYSFQFDTSHTGDNVEISISATDPPIKEFRLQKEGHDPAVRWSILSHYVFINKGFYSILGPKLDVQWKILKFITTTPDEPEITEDKKPESKKTDNKKTNKKPINKENGKSGKSDPMLDALQKLKDGSIGFWGISLVCLVVFFQGMIHAFAPGHGKSLVAAYLAGKQGRIRDAVILGVIVTSTHLVSVYILALGGIALIHNQSQSAYKDQVVVGMQLVSAVLLFMLGVVLFRKALRKGDDHGHSHGHHHGHEHGHVHAEHNRHTHNDHDHKHNADEEPPRFKQLLLVGLTGGIVPCPAGLTAVFVAWYLNLFWTALILLFFLSLGLGGSLIAIGITVVLTRKLIEKKSTNKKQGKLLTASRKILTILPAFSAAFIACLGIFLFYITLKSQGEIVAAILRSLADLLL